jgi:uncharacterized protein YfiM (DUF2279 family)
VFSPLALPIREYSFAKKSGVLQGSASLGFTPAGDLSVNLQAQITVSFTPAGDISADGTLSGAASLTFSEAAITSSKGLWFSNYAISPLALPIEAYDFAGTTGGLAGGTTLAFSEVGAIDGSGALSVASSKAFSTSGTLRAQGGISASESLSFSLTGRLIAGISGVSSLTFTHNVTPGGTGTLSGASTHAYSSSGILAETVPPDVSPLILPGVGYNFQPKPQGVLSGVSDLRFTEFGRLSKQGSSEGSITFSLTASGDGYGASIRTGVLEWDFTTQGNIVGIDGGPIFGAATLSFADSATLTADGDLFTNQGIVFTPAGELRKIGEFGGTSDLTFTTTSNLQSKTSFIDGSASLTFTESPNLGSRGGISGTSSLTFDASGNNISATPGADGTSTLTFSTSGSARDQGTAAGSVSLGFTTAGSAAAKGSLVDRDADLNFVGSAKLIAAGTVLGNQGFNPLPTNSA